MIKRVFSEDVYPELQAEFEDKFSNLALPDTRAITHHRALHMLNTRALGQQTRFLVCQYSQRVQDCIIVCGARHK